MVHATIQVEDVDMKSHNGDEPIKNSESSKLSQIDPQKSMIPNPD